MLYFYSNGLIRFSAFPLTVKNALYYRHTNLQDVKESCSTCLCI